MGKMDIHLAPDKVLFSLFTTEEIKKMCVMQIITPLMLDPLGHPIPGGLYDKRLGKILVKYLLVVLHSFKIMLFLQAHYQTNQMYVKLVIKL